MENKAKSREKSSSRQATKEPIPQKQAPFKYGAHQLDQEVNLPDIAGKRPTQQFKKKDIEILTQSNVQSQLVSAIRTTSNQQSVSQHQKYALNYTHKFNTVRADEPVKADYNLPDIVHTSPSQKKIGGATQDYVSLGAKVQEHLKERRTGRATHKRVNMSQQPLNREVEEMDDSDIAHMFQRRKEDPSEKKGFENFMRNVVQSVERRKKAAYLTQRLKSITEPSQIASLAQQVHQNPTFSNFSNPVIPHRSSKSPLPETIEEQEHDDSRVIDKRHSRQTAPSSGDHAPEITQFIDNKASEQVANLLQRVQGKLFIPLKREMKDGQVEEFKEVKNAPIDHAGMVVFSSQGFVKVGAHKGQESDFISNQQYIQDGVTKQIYGNLPFFQKFRALCVFKQWKVIMRRNAYERRREQLAANWHFSKPVFAKRFEVIAEKVNSIRSLKLQDVGKNVIYGKRQQATLEERSNKVLALNRERMNADLEVLLKVLKDLKNEIQMDDERFEKALKDSRMQQLLKQKQGEELVLFSKQRKIKQEEEEQQKLQRMRQHMFDKLSQLVLRIATANLTELLVRNKHDFKEIFTCTRNGPQFEICVCFNADGQLDTDPSTRQHYASFLQLFEDMERTVFQNKCVQQFLGELNSLLFRGKELPQKTVFGQIRQTLKEDRQYQSDHEAIFSELKSSIESCEDYTRRFQGLQAIYDFFEDWTLQQRDKQIALEMDFYKETWEKMETFTKQIEEIPSTNVRRETILVETHSLKNYLKELPKSVVKSIRDNVAQTMETETKTLREELAKATEILDQLPSSLNVYVEQVNTLKYVKEKTRDFDQRYETINKLHQLCKSDNIRVSLSLQVSMEEVASLYTRMPDITATAQRGLQENKATMERIMQNSSTVLSKKIKGFEKKYTESYLQDISRYEDCADTLEELFKRSKAIYEIRSKVILYKEFLKLLYEDEHEEKRRAVIAKLQCAEDYEFLQDLHKQTIRMWKMLLYWKKRKNVCYTLPFLQLDVNKIMRSIHKVTQFFEIKLRPHPFLKEKSRSIWKKVIHQVKDTSQIIDFLKDLKKDCLQGRHWVQIFQLIKAPHLKNSDTFTIVNLREYHVQNYREEIQKIIEHANTELKYQKRFEAIKKEWDSLELQAIPYKGSTEQFILISTDSLVAQIEENLTQLELIQQSKFSGHIGEEVEEWIVSLKQMLSNLELMVEAQRFWVNLDPIFEGEGLSQIFMKKDLLDFQEIRQQFKRIMWSTSKSPLAAYNLKIHSRMPVFEKLIKYFSSLQQKVTEYLEQKRLAFPRFFFLTDAQFLEFLTLANSNQDFNDFISTLFPGAHKLFVNMSRGNGRTESDGPPLQNNQQDLLDSETVQEGLEFSQLVGDKQLLARDGVFNSGQPAQPCFEVLGMISHVKELFLFEQPVKMEGVGVDQLLSRVQEQMQDSLSKQINYAVSAFPRQTLDEWVLDFPQQVILTTIHLILSHEITELLEELYMGQEEARKKRRNSEDEEGESEMEEQNVTPNTRDMIKRQPSAYSRTIRSQKPTEPSVKSKSHRGSVVGEDLPADQTVDQLDQQFTLEKQEEAEIRFHQMEAKIREVAEERYVMSDMKLPPDANLEKREFLDDMLGRDFSFGNKIIRSTFTEKMREDGTVQIHTNLDELKENVMALLQKKSFEGLFLRLQFWVNQLCKSLHGSQSGSLEKTPLPQPLHPVQQMVLRSVVQFLLYQRDLVLTLMSQQTFDPQAYEWQSQVRLEWAGQGCRVECGGWSTQQGNEYLGSQARMLVTPQTNRYFVFICAALREKSAVLFKCSTAHSQGKDVFDEFSSVCAIAHKSFQSCPETHSRSLLQCLNGAALASVWIFFEHLDRLPYVTLQAFNKEVQMVQQQFIIAELSGQEVNRSHLSKGSSAVVQRDIRIGEQSAEGASKPYSPKSPERQSMNSRDQVSKMTSMKEDDQSFSRAESRAPPRGKICFGVFGSVSHSLGVKFPQLSEEMTQHLSSAFRPLSLTRPSEDVLLAMLFKASGFELHAEMTQRTVRFIQGFERERMFLLTAASAKKAKSSTGASRPSKLAKEDADEKPTLEQEIETQFALTGIETRDLRVLVKVAGVMREQEVAAFREQIRSRDQDREILARGKSRDQKLADREQRQADVAEEKRVKLHSELVSVRETLRQMWEGRFFCQWREIYKLRGELDKIDVPKVLARTVDKTLQDYFMKEPENEDGKKPAKVSFIESGAKGTDLLKYSERNQSEKALVTTLEATLEQVASTMHLEILPKQLKKSLEAIQLMRILRGIVFLGPTCSGKTTLLKLVSNTLNKAFGVKMRTSVVNAATFSEQELYGSTEAFTDRKQQSLFQVILNAYETEFKGLKTELERQMLAQSLFFDQEEIQSSLAESFVPFLDKANQRQREDFASNEFLSHLTSKFQNSPGIIETCADIEVSFPNSNSMLFPPHLYLFFETLSLQNASPAFISRIGLVQTEEEDVSWEAVWQKSMRQMIKKHQVFFDDQELDSKYLFESFREFLAPFVMKIGAHPKLAEWPLWNLKSLTVQFFSFLNALLCKLGSISQKMKENDDPENLNLKVFEKDTFYNLVLQSSVLSYGAVLNREQRRVFEEAFMFYKRRFNMNIQSMVPSARNRFSLFDMYFDCHKLRWDFLQDNLDYKMKMHHDQVRGMLLIPTLEFSQAYFSMETLYSTLWFDNTRDKAFRLLGPPASGKSTILQTYMKRNPERFNALWTPMSAFMSTKELKKNVEAFYSVKRKSKLEPKDPSKRVIIVIDDLHLHENYKDNLVDFIRTWTASHGYFDMKEGIFKEVGDFGVLLAQNSQYGKHSKTLSSKEENRYLFYTCTQYMEEPEQEKTKLFIQHWLTSRMWNCSKLINKYYILITNVLMTLFDKMMRTNDFNRSSFLELTNFHFVAKFCQHLTNFTFLSDVWAELVPKNRREEDAVAEMVSYEIMRTFSDRILFPNQRQAFLTILKDAIKQEFFSGGYLSVEYLDKLVMGNYHEKKPTAYVKYASQSEENEQKVKQKVREIVKEDSTNQFLEAYLDSPNGLKEVFRISRLLYKENMHGLLVGPNGTGKLEHIQIAAIVNQAVVLELSASKFNDAVKFMAQLKSSMLSALKLQSFTFLAIEEVHHADIAYVDAIYNILQALQSFQNSIVFDQDFINQLCQVEEQNLSKKEDKQATTEASASKKEILFFSAMRKIQKYFHICLLVDNLQTYQDWISSYPSLEHQMEVMYFDELALKGYQKMANSFFENKKLETSDISIAKSLSQGRQIAKNRILDVFYTPAMMTKTVGEDFHDCLGEFIFSKADKLHKFMYYDSDFEPIDADFKQKFPNVKVSIRQTYKSRFVLYLELFRFLYDFLSLSLLVRQNYLETYLKKSSEFTEFFRKIKGTKNTLHCESTELSVKLYQLRDKRDNIRMLLGEKQQAIQRRQQESKLQQVELRAYQKEVDEVIRESNQRLAEVVAALKDIKQADFQYLLTTIRFAEAEKGLLNIIAVIIDQDPEAEYSREAHQAYFVDRAELSQLLLDKGQADVDGDTLSRLRFWLADVQSADFKRPLFEQLHAYVASAFKRLSVRTVMYATYKKIDEIKEILESCKFSISYSQQFTIDKSRELAEVESKISNLEQMETNLSKRIEEAEISHMRTEHIYDQIDEYHQLQMQKLESVKERLRNLQGDCIMLASSVTYLSVFSMRERVLLRQELCRYMQAQTITTSECWRHSEYNQHCKMFKRILKEYGLKPILKKHSFYNGVSQEAFAETLFALVFAPSCPVLFDPSGHVLEFLQSAVLNEVPAKTLYASDSQINAQLETVFRNQQFCVVKDLNDQSSGRLGLSQEKSLLHRLAATIHNGFDFNYEKLAKLKQLKVTRNFCSSFNSVNKRLPANLPQFENLSLYQVMVASPRFGLALNSQYEAKATLTLALDAENDVILRQANTSWVDIKETMLKHLQPETYAELARVKQELQKLSLQKDTLRKNFENCFLVANQDTLQVVNEYSVLKQSIEEIFMNSAATQQAREKYESLINKNSMFSTYANTILIMYLSLKKLSKLMDEVTYSWSRFNSIVDQVLAKVMRDLKQKQEPSQEPDQKLSREETGSQTPVKIDEAFFKQALLPQIHGVVCTSVKQPLVSLFNLVLALLIGLKAGTVTEDEVDLFYKRFFELPSAHLWRQHDHEFMGANELIEKTRYFSVKRDLFKLYPEDANLRLAVELLEKEAGSEFSFRKLSQTLNQKILVSKPGSDLSLILKIQLGFVCPDQQFKSRLVQLVYEQIQPVFDFQEDLLKLHSFIKTASWRQPIALLSSNGINVINTVCSIASFYGVGLEVLRTDLPLDEEHVQKVSAGQSESLVQANLKDGFSHQEGFLRRKLELIHPDLQRVTQERASYLDAQDQSDPILCQKNNYRACQQKDQLQLEEKPQPQSQESALQVVRECARQGSWVFVSTLKFPTFWRKICSLLREMNNEVSNNFRIYFDLQGFIHGEIPDSFLFEESVVFHLGAENNEDMEGFNDIWANILNGKILADISSVKDASVESRGATREARRHIPYNPDRTQKEILRDQIEQIEAIDEGLSKSGYSKDPANSLVFSAVLPDARNLKSQGTRPPVGSQEVKRRSSEAQIFSQLQQKPEPLPNEVLVEEDMGGAGLVSAINSNENSVDISRGEKALIKDLQASGMQGAQSHKLHEALQPEELKSEKTEFVSSPNKNVSDQGHSQILTRGQDWDKSLEDEIKDVSMSGASERARAELQKRSGVQLHEELDQ